MANLIAPLDTRADYDTHTVYLITHPNLPTVYYGVTRQQLEHRFGHHLRSLQNGYHSCKDLQAAFDERPHGWTVHEVAKLLEPEAELLEAELIAGDPLCFNMQKNPRKRINRHAATLDSVQRVLTLLAQGDLFQYQIARLTGFTQPEVSQIHRGKHVLQVTA